MEDMFTMLKVSASALEAQKIRMNVIASNIANVNSTRTPEGGPYKRKDVTFESHMFNENAVGVDIPKIGIIQAIDMACLNTSIAHYAEVNYPDGCLQGEERFRNNLQECGKKIRNMNKIRKAK